MWVRVVAPAGDRSVLVLPDACSDLIWQPGRGAYVVGPDTGPAPSPVAPGEVMVGVRFRPGAGGPALGVPLSGLLDQRLHAADLAAELAPGPARERARGIGAAVPGTLSPVLALRRLTGLAGAMAAAGPPDPLVQAAVRYLARPGAQADQAASDLGVSERQLRRRCLATVGYGPAMLRRVLRFRRFVSALDAAGGRADLGLLAAEAGYADQAHLTRESGRLGGLTPAALAASRHPAAAA
jgi:AraC-like DNA-binding protein